jgi:hypothetical protein
MVEGIAAVVDDWQDLALKAQISAAEVDLMAGAFRAHREFRESV